MYEGRGRGRYVKISVWNLGDPVVESVKVMWGMGTPAPKGKSLRLSTVTAPTLMTASSGVLGSIRNEPGK